MYKRHKWLIAVIFVTVFIVAAFLEADYSEIAESSISVMAIAIAVYIGATSVILGSAYAEKMKSQVDPEIRTSSSLGVLASYLRTAGTFGIGTIVISTMYSLGIGNQQLMALFSGNHHLEWIVESIHNVISSLACGLFAVNIVFMYLILVFLINSMTKSV